MQNSFSFPSNITPPAADQGALLQGLATTLDPSEITPVSANRSLLGAMVDADLRSAVRVSGGAGAANLEALSLSPGGQLLLSDFKALSPKIKQWIKGRYGAEAKTGVSNAHKGARKELYKALKSIVQPSVLDRVFARPNTSRNVALAYLVNTLSSHTPMALLQELSLFLVESGSASSRVTPFADQTSLEAAAYRTLVSSQYDIDHTLVLLVLASEGDIALAQVKGLDLASECILQQKAGLVTHLKQVGVDLNAQNSKGQSLGHVALSQGREAAVKSLMKLGVDLNIRNSAGLTPLHTAVKDAHPGMISTLIKAGADVLKLDPDGRNSVELATYYERCAGVLHSLQQDHWVAFQRNGV